MLNRLLTLVLLAGCSVSSVTFTPIGFDGGVGAADTRTPDTQAPDTGVPEDLQAPITVTKTGSGTVTSRPAGIDCGATCARPFRDGTSVTLTAAPSAGFVFAGWSGACTGPTCTLDVVGSAGIDVTATFSPMPMITVTLAGDAAGAVDSSPPGILCPGACSAPFPPGMPVVLTAHAGAAPSAFAGWSIAACPGTGPCTLTPTDDVTAITATFTKPGSATFTAAGSFTIRGSGGGGANGHQGSYAPALALFSVHAVTAAPGGAVGTSSHAGGSGGGGVFLDGTGPGGANGAVPASGKGGAGYGGGGGGGGYDGATDPARFAGGNGAAGLVYLEW